jgi:hypothetical protein
MKRYGAEFIGTFWLVLGGCGSAVLAAGGWALSQLWLFWIAPIIGGTLGALAYRAIADEESLSPRKRERKRESELRPWIDCSGYWACMDSVSRSRCSTCSRSIRISSWHVARSPSTSCSSSSG